ncbi:MAG TPA: hypothetical protein VFY79_11820 [Dehalococcoidia bacterium]|nr:hypothetical protein [Dehalococcoidia bacterium]
MRISIDFDGVLCHTPFGRMATRAPGGVPELPEGYAALYDAPSRPRRLRLGLEYVRFGWRRMDPRAQPVLRALSEQHEVTIVTGRSIAGEALVARWLRRTGLDARVGLRMAPPGLRPPQHKLAVARILGIDAHLDDDPRTAHYLAEHGVAHVYLLDRAGLHASDAELPANLRVVRALDEFADAIAAIPS